MREHTHRDIHSPHSSERRRFLKTTLLAGAATALPRPESAAATPPAGGERPQQDKGLHVLNPRGGRVPVSFVIDDSTCLVNMAYYGLPQFMEAWPGHREKYKNTDWKNWPREIPDSFVLKFGRWCRENGVKGKYSVVPFPACVGWVDRVMPGWSGSELRDSLKIVREFTLRIESENRGAPTLLVGKKRKPLSFTKAPAGQTGLTHNQWRKAEGSIEMCFEISKGMSQITFAS